MRVFTTVAMLLLLLAGCDQSPAVDVKTASAPPPAAVKPRDGIGVAIVVDISGSMSGTVNDTGGHTSPKDEIARRAVRELFSRSQGFCQRNPERTVEVGLFAFDDKVSQIMPFAKPDPTAAAGPINTLRPNGGTAIGAAILSAKQALDATGLSAKHIVVVTDGENTANRDYTSSNPANAVNIDPRTALACTNAKAQGITVFVVKVIEGNSDMLRACATRPDYFYDLSSASQLNTALSAVFEAIKKTRLTQ